MQISPQRRQRMLREHHLRQSGYSQAQIARELNVSRATVHADLKLLEAEWSVVAELTHDDLLLDQIERINLRLQRLLSLEPVDLIEQLGLPMDIRVSLAEMIRLYTVHQQSINAAARELRLLLRQLRTDTRQRADENIDIELVDAADVDDEQLAEPEPGWNELNKPEQSEHLIPSKTQEIPSSPPAHENSAEHLNIPLPRNTGRNKPCPCNSGKKRKHCHPQSLAPPQPLSSAA